MQTYCLTSLINLAVIIWKIDHSDYSDVFLFDATWCYKGSTLAVLLKIKCLYSYCKYRNKTNHVHFWTNHFDLLSHNSVVNIPLQNFNWFLIWVAASIYSQPGWVFLAVSMIRNFVISNTTSHRVQ